MNTSQTTSSSKRVTAAQIGLEALAGCIAGLLGGALFGFVGARLFVGTSGDWGDLVGAVLGAMAGYVLGVSLGAWAAGRRLHGGGAYWLSLVGSVAGAALVLLLAEPLRLNVVPLLLQIAFVLITALAAALTLHMGPRR